MILQLMVLEISVTIIIKKKIQKNIERITFLINGKDYEFVACQD